MFHARLRSADAQQEQSQQVLVALKMSFSCLRQNAHEGNLEPNEFCVK